MLNDPFNKIEKPKKPFLLYKTVISISDFCQIL